MKRLLISALISTLLCTGCNDNIDIESYSTSSKLLVSFEEVNTRVYLGDDYYFRWELDNRVSVFLGDTQNREYATEIADVIVSPISAVEEGESTNNDNGHNSYAIFPYRDNNEITYDSNGGCVIRSFIDAEQQYRADAPNLNSAIMVSTAKPSSKLFIFRNSCALIKVNIKTTEKYKEIAKINRIVVGSRYNDIAGPVIIDMNGDFTAHIDNNALSGTTTNTITLVNTASAGSIGVEYKSFYIAIPAEEYNAGEITIDIDCDDDKFDYTAVLTKGYALKRSEYIELSTTIDPDKKDTTVDKDEEDGGYDIKDDITLVNETIMSYTENLITQGFYDQDDLESMLPIPSGEYTVDGDFLVKGNNHTLKFTATDKSLFVMNTFTTLNSGYKDITPPTVTVNDLTITGELRCTTLGIYCHSWMPMYGNRADQSAFSTVWNNVKVLDNKIVSYTGSFGAAVIVYGKGVLNNCEVHGTTRSELENPPIAPNLFDMYSVNNSNTIINGGKFGNIATTEHTEMTINDGAVINSLHWYGINNARKRNMLTVNSAEIGTLYLSSTYFKRYPPRILITSEAKIDVINITVNTNTSRMAIEPGAQVGKVIVLGDEMTLEEFIDNYNIASSMTL